MEFVFETLYDKKALIDMARAMRKTVRGKDDRRNNILTILIVILTIFISFTGDPEVPETYTFIKTLWIVVPIIVLVALLQDRLNASISKMRLMKGAEKAICTFKENFYISDAQIGKTEFKYECITAIAETERYFVFLLDKLYAQAYDKTTLKGGTVEEFRKFIEEKTKIEVKKVK